MRASLIVAGKVHHKRSRELKTRSAARIGRVSARKFSRFCPVSRRRGLQFWRIGFKSSRSVERTDVSQITVFLTPTPQGGPFQMAKTAAKKSPSKTEVLTSIADETQLKKQQVAAVF